MNKKILVIIPAFNEEKSIGKVIEDIEEHLSSAEILVVNDGSFDSTRKVAEEKNVSVINLPYNLGIGGAMQTGYRFANQGNYDIVVQCDADGQHLAKEIDKLLEPIMKDETDLVIGSRYFEKNNTFKSSISRRIGIRILSRICSLLAGQKFTDPTSGFRAGNWKVIKSCALYYPEDYPEVESLMFLQREGFRIKDVPVKMNERRSGKSSISFFGAFYYMVKVILGVIIDRLETSPYSGEK